MELYRKYRPKTLKGMVGQDGAVASLQRLMDRNSIPHALLFTGPSGCGKTTAARIVREFLQCGENDFHEINCADFKGIDTVRDIRRVAGLHPIGGESRVYLIDEAHKLTNDAQNAFLKLLEDAPSRCYFMLATTDPQKLIRTILTRSTEIKFEALCMEDLERVIQRVADKEALQISQEVVEAVAEAAEGSARKALVILEQVGTLEGTDAQLQAVRASTFNKDEAINLARQLVTNPHPDWNEVARILRALKDQDVEGVRYCVLGYARACMVGSETRAPSPKLGPQAFKVIDIFSRNMYDSKQAGLAAACWEVVHS